MSGRRGNSYAGRAGGQAGRRGRKVFPFAAGEASVCGPEGAALETSPAGGCVVKARATVWVFEMGNERFLIVSVAAAGLA